MVELEKLREAEPEAQRMAGYEDLFTMWQDCQTRAREGKVVIKGSERGWEEARQGVLKWFIHPMAPDCNTSHWFVFLHDIRTHSGRHRHQGGLVIFVVEGQGYTIVDGKRIDWEAGDLILLPIKPQGVVHQHFNREPGKPCKWLAFIYEPFIEALGAEMQQVETSPDWRKREEGHEHA